MPRKDVNPTRCRHPALIKARFFRLGRFAWCPARRENTGMVHASDRRSGWNRHSGPDQCSGSCPPSGSVSHVEPALHLGSGSRSGKGRYVQVGRPYVVYVDDIPVQVTAKRIRNVYLRVKPPDGRVEVTAPVSMSDGRIAEFVRSRRAWIDHGRQRIALAVREREVSRMEAGGRADGDVEPGAAAGPGHAGGQQAGGVGFQHGAGCKTMSDRDAQARRMLESRLPPLLERWVPIVGKGPTAVTLRSMKTRWGSCTPDTGRIRINLELAWVDEDLLEYVVVHELTHLHARGHGARFQQLMTAYLPDWKDRRRRLNRHVIV